MKIYHGVPSPRKMEKCRDAAPSHEHGAEWLPTRMTDHNWPWIMDNGAYTGSFNPREWRTGLNYGENAMPRDPDFVVLPDKFGDWEATKHMHERYSQWVPEEWPTAVVAQPGGSVEDIVRFADRIGSDVVFIGGPQDWKREFAGQIVMTAHDYGMRAHIGKPGVSLSWARDLGVDSVDTTSVVRNESYGRLRKLEASSMGEQLELGEAGI